MKIYLPIILSLFLISSKLAAQSSDDPINQELSKKQSKIDSLNRVIFKLSEEMKNQKTNVESVEFEKLKNDISNLKSELNNTRFNLYKAHDKFRSGTTLKFIGLTSMIIGSLALASSSNSNSGNDGAFVMYIGGLLTFTIGSLVSLDSHKYFGYAGTKKRSVNRTLVE